MLAPHSPFTSPPRRPLHASCPRTVSWASRLRGSLKVLALLLIGSGAQAAEIKALPGFRVEQIYSVPKAEQGSWVSMTVDAKGRLITCDQYGSLYLVTPPAVGTEERSQVSRIESSVGGAHGLLYASGSLYVMVNEVNDKQGIWRLRDKDGDSHFEAPERISELSLDVRGGGEHGVHGLALGPDGKSIWFAAGNFSSPPKSWDHRRPGNSAPDRVWSKLAQVGNPKGMLAGYIARLDLQGGGMELVSMGFRNQYDLAFDPNGELFTYDSDLEFEMGLPWYVPTRICQVTSGSDFGYRNYADRTRDGFRDAVDRWPPYLEDGMAPVKEIGPGCPTGVTFGTGARFPAKYQHAFYACDWTYGTIYAVHLKPDGAGFRAETEEFLAGKPLPLSDVVISPQDGAMYFTVGGRKMESGLYRVTYAGSESTEKAAYPPPTEGAKLRRELESLHGKNVGLEAIDKAWPHLGSPDRLVRHAARVALEHQPLERWSERALAERDPQASVEALIALTRTANPERRADIAAALERMRFESLSVELQLGWLRVWELLMTRMGPSSAEETARLCALLEPHFPQKDWRLTRELARMLAYLGSEALPAKAVPLLDVPEDQPEVIHSASLSSRNLYGAWGGAVNHLGTTRPNRQQIALACALRDVPKGWTPALRRQYFAWFLKAHRWNGGALMLRIIDQLRADALRNLVPDAGERALLEATSARPPAQKNLVRAVPKGPGKNYRSEEVVALASRGLKGRNFAQGKAMFDAALCSGCHTLNGAGGVAGPDLSGAGIRYTVRDLVENIVEPSKVISDQYQTTQIETVDGNVITGRVVSENAEALSMMTNPFLPAETVAVKVGDIHKRTVLPVSLMPPGLLNSLGEDELLDLLAFLISGGNPEDPAFTR